MPSRLSDRLVNAGRVSADTMRSAIARQAVYGGALDTALLETDAIDEPLLWEELGVATGLPMPEPALCENPVKCVNPDGSAIELDGSWSERARAVPVGVKNGALQILCGEPLVRRRAGRGVGAPGRAVPALHRPRGQAGGGPPGGLRSADAAAPAAAVRARGGGRAGAPLADRAREAREGRREATGWRCCRAGRRRRSPQQPRRDEGGEGSRGRATAPGDGRAELPAVALARPRKAAGARRQSRGGEADRAALSGRDGDKAREELVRITSRTSAPRPSAGRRGGRSTRTTTASSGCSRGWRTRSRTSARPPKRSCAR